MKGEYFYYYQYIAGFDDVGSPRITRIRINKLLIISKIGERVDDIASMKETYKAMGYSERLAFLFGLKCILEGEMGQIGQDYDQTDSKVVRLQLLKSTSELQGALHAVKDSSKDSREEPSMIQESFWEALEKYLGPRGD